MPKLINVSKKWGNRSIFDNLTLEFDKDKTTAIIGKSGIGKTTLKARFQALAGYLTFSKSRAFCPF